MFRQSSLLPFLAIAIGAAAPAQQIFFRLDPAVVTECAPAGLGREQMVWSVPSSGPVQVRFGAPDGPPVTGLEPPSGSQPTGDWVRDGMIFVLVDAAGRELSRATAAVDCAARSAVVQPALANAPYLPLDVGNEWIFRLDTRQVTSDYAVFRIVRAERLDGVTWFVMRSGDSETLYRTDASGRIYRRARSNGTTLPEELFLDPASAPNPAAVARVDARGLTIATQAGSFPNALQYSIPGFVTETGYYAPGVGLVKSTQTLLAGSSGGFTQGLELIRARIDGHLVFDAPASVLELGVESPTIDLTHKLVTNCAVPCYFTACGLAPGADPLDTFKPCFRVDLRVRSTIQGQIDLEFDDPSGVPRFSAALPLDAAGGTGEWIRSQQIPLYAAPNNPFAPGLYSVRAALRQAAGAAPAASATVSVELR